MSKSGISSVTGLSSKYNRRNSKKLSLTSTSDVFKESLYEACKELNMPVYPSIKCLSSEPLPWIFQETSSNLDVTCKRSVHATTKKSLKQLGDVQPEQYDVEKQLVSHNEEIFLIYPNTLICKQFRMNDVILGALQKAVVKLDFLRVLKLEFCELTSDQLRGVKFILLEKPNIIDVSLDGNHIPKDPQFILLKRTKIRHLSLKFCKFSDKGIFNLNKVMQNPESNGLITLNLSSNQITDVGVKHLADILRVNRTITHINLSDNFITDVGVIELMKVMRKFPLTHNEIVLRRRKNLHRLLLKDEIRYDLTKNKKGESNISLIKNDLVSKRSCSSARMRMTTVNQKRRNSADSHKSLESLIESKLPKDSYPFVHECTAENGQVYCRGNVHLQYLNLSYNKITDEGLEFVKDTLRKLQMQRIFENPENKIVKIILEGNYIKHPDVVSYRSNESKASSKSSVKERKENVYNKINK